MIAKKTRRYLEMAMGNVSHSDRELQEEVKKELCELEEASEKQTPKKPIEKQVNVNGDLIGLCSACNEMWVIKYKGYCANCGQKLDWD